MNGGGTDPRLAALQSDADSLLAQLKATIPKLSEARQNYAQSRTSAHRAARDAIQSEARDLKDRFSRVIGEMKRVIGISDADLEELLQESLGGDPIAKIRRRDLTHENVASTGTIDDLLPGAFDQVCRLINPAWLADEAGEHHRLAEITNEQPLSLVRGLRPQSEFPSIHRFRQCLRLAKDYLDGEPTYDHFGGALLLPQLTQLGSRLPVIRQVGGDVETRLAALWQGPSEQSDTTAFELLVAAGCVQHGRSVEFITPSAAKSPDIRCHDPFPLVIECKRKRALSDYEIAEESAMRGLFERLHKVARDKSAWGCYQLTLAVEYDRAPIEEVVSCLTRQRLCAHPERDLQYDWGKVAFRELPRRAALPRTRAYSPNMLAHVFQWNTDLPAWDGIICRIGPPREAVIDEVSQAIGLLWSNHSRRAILKRSWSPLDVFGDAMNQIPPGEFGIIYVAYQEGTRAEIADERVEKFGKRISQWTHSADIRVPISFLLRLYPRPLTEGAPDLIESTIRYLSGEYGDPALFQEFPNVVFTPPPPSN